MKNTQKASKKEPMTNRKQDGGPTFSNQTWYSRTT